jgi:signal transduction histidine kinase
VRERTARQTERWIAWMRAGGVAFAVLEIGVFTEKYPDGYERWAWITTGIFALGALLFGIAVHRVPDDWLGPLGFAAQAFDTLIVATFALLYSFEYGSPTRWALIIVVVEAALRWGILGGIVLPLALVPFLWLCEHWRATRFGPPGFLDDRVSFPAGILLITGTIVGWLVARLRDAATAAGARAAEAEELRDQLGRRVDVLDAASRCARALSSSLELEQAFGAFIRELAGLLPYDRVAIVLAEAGSARVMAVAGEGTDAVFPPGSRRPIEGTILAVVMRRGQPVYREDLAQPRYPEEHELVSLGLRSRVAAPLLAGSRAIGMLSLVRRDPSAFDPQEVELIGLLGRFVAGAVQNIRAYEAEHRTVEELRRLSALRADFVSLVSHELRSPMAAVIGAAQTLQQRWRELGPDQREAFLGLIAQETTRLAALIGDVLDTSRIEAGTFSYSFEDVDLGALVDDSVESATVGQDEVPVRAEVAPALPRIRGDRARLRQILANLIDNAVKYSPAGEEVEVRAYRDDGRIVVAVRDRGPGVPAEDQGLIFEKFGRVATGGHTKPGTGLGLFIARSIAEAHGGRLAVESAPGHGAVFTLELPVDA